MSFLPHDAAAANAHDAFAASPTAPLSSSPAILSNEYPVIIAFSTLSHDGCPSTGGNKLYQQSDFFKY